MVCAISEKGKNGKIEKEQHNPIADYSITMKI